MKFNESLLKSKIKENLSDVKNDLDRDSKATAIVEALNFFDVKRDWVKKINRDEIISLVTNSPSQEVLCESVIAKVNNTPFTKALKENKNKKNSKKLNESLESKPLTEQKLEEGTSNFYDHDYLPLLVFIDLDELENAMIYDSEYPNEDDYYDIEGEFRSDDYYYDLEVFRDNYYDKHYKGVCVLGEEDEDQLRVDLGNFNDETKRMAYETEDGDDETTNWDLEDIKLIIEPGYYEGYQIYCENEKNFDYLTENTKKTQLERFNNFLNDLQKKYGLTKLGVAYRFSNGETGYNIMEELKHLNESIKKTVKFAVPESEMGAIQKKIDDCGFTINSLGNKEGYDEFEVVGDADKEDCWKVVDDLVKEINTRKNVTVTRENLEEAKDDLQTKATKMMSVKKYYIDMAWKNGKTWKTEPMTLDEIGQSVDAKVTEQQFVDMMSNNIKGRKDAKNLTKAEIVKVYDYMDGQWQGKDVLWSINGKTNESLNESEYVGNAKIITELPKINDQYGYKDHYVKKVTKLDTKDGYTTYEVVTQEKGSEDLGDTVDIAKWEVALKENLNEDKSSKPNLPKKVTLSKDVVDGFEYDDGDVDDDSLQECINNYLSDEYGYCINDYNYKCHYDEDGKLIGIDIYNIDWDLTESLKEDNDYYAYMDKDYADILDANVDVYDIKQFVLNDTDNKYRTHYTDEYALITCPNGKGCVVDYEAVGQDFDNLDSEIEFGIEENKDNEYTDEQGNTHKTINIFATHSLTTTPKEVMEKAPKKTMKYRDFFRKYKYNDRCANNFKELVSYIRENGGLQEGCHSKKKKTLKEGYIGQTLEDFFYDCVDPDLIETVTLWGEDDEIYNGDYDGAIEEYGNNEFIEFDCGMDKVVINVDTSEEYQVTDYFIDVEDFLEFYNGDEIEVFDFNTGETLFSGDRYDLPDDVAEKIFVSFDAPKFISINVEEDGGSDDDFDESLKEDWVKHFKNFDYYPNEDENKFIVIKTDGNGKTLDKFEIDVTTYEDAKKYIKDNLLEKVVNEDTVKQGDKWVNKGNTGETHGEFKTKKEADKQRKAMFAGRKPNAKWGK